MTELSNKLCLLVKFIHQLSIYLFHFITLPLPSLGNLNHHR